MAELIPLAAHCFSDRTKMGVDARHLYLFLGLNPVHWARWVKRNILGNPYALAHEDWESFHPAGEERIETRGKGRPTQEYVLSLDFAKKLSMMTRSAKGEEARHYFLACEEAAMKSTQTPQVRDPAIQMLIDMAVHLDTVRAEAAEAKVLATRAMEGQQWMTIRQYVLVYALQAQMPESLQAEYGRWLTGYRLEHNIPVYKTSTADRAWGTEQTYHAGTIAATLRPWRLRRANQPALQVIYTQPPDEPSTVQEPGAPYRAGRRRR